MTKEAKLISDLWRIICGACHQFNVRRFFVTYRFPQSTLLITRSFSSRVLSVVRVPAKSNRRHSSNSRITLRNALNL